MFFFVVVRGAMEWTVEITGSSSSYNVPIGSERSLSGGSVVVTPRRLSSVSPGAPRGQVVLTDPIMEKRPAGKEEDEEGTRGFPNSVCWCSSKCKAC
jgi:hypothetical protein